MLCHRLKWFSIHIFSVHIASMRFCFYTARLFSIQLGPGHFLITVCCPTYCFCATPSGVRKHGFGHTSLARREAGHMILLLVGAGAGEEGSVEEIHVNM